MPRSGAGEYAGPAAAAPENVARTLAVEWARFGVRAVAIAPGPRSTDDELAALVVFALGVLGVWLVKPIGDACPDVGRLPAGSQSSSSSSPSIASPLTRTCTYTERGRDEGAQALRAGD